MVYTGVQRVTVGPDETIVELHDATEGRCPVRLTPMAVQEVVEALAQALVQIRGAQPALERPLYSITDWAPLMNGRHEHALLLTTFEGLQFAVALDAELRAQLRAHLALLRRRRSRRRCTDARMPHPPYTVL